MNDWNDLNPDDLLSLMEDIQDENEHLKKDNSEKQQQIYELSSEVSMLKTAMTEMQQKHQSERQKLTSCIARQKEEMCKLQKDNRLLQQNNDRLRNNDGVIEAGTEDGISNYDDEPENEDDYPLRWPEPSRTPDDYNYFW